MKLYINANGINTESEVPNPDYEEVKKCLKYLSNVNERDKYTKYSSYTLKNSIEAKDGYVSNGAFIEALSKLKMNYKRCSDDSLNVYVKFNREDLERAILEVSIKNVIENTELNKFHYAVNMSRTVGYCTNIKELNNFLKNSIKLEFTKEELYVFLTKIELIRFNYKDFLIDEFLDSIKVNISLKKLKRMINNSNKLK